MKSNDIVVGVDGSPTSDTAVRWAAREAEHTGSQLRIITSFDWNRPSGQSGTVDELYDRARTCAEEVVVRAENVAREIEPALVPWLQTVPGSPATALLEAAEQARLVVVGNRGRGGFAGLRLGSVGERVAVHARCPVAVIRGRPGPTDGPVVVGVDRSPASLDAVETAFHLASRLQ